ATLPVLLAPAVPASGAAHARCESGLAATTILLAAERQRRKTGAWPASIADIDRAILPEAPVDEFSGEPFRLTHRDGQLIVYSVGLNRKDEQGAFDRKTYHRGGPDDFNAVAWDQTLRGQPFSGSERK